MADVEEVSAEIAGQKVSLKSVAVNTVLTLFIALGVGAIGMMTWQHQGESKEAQAAFVVALKEQTVAMKEGTAANREQTCMLRFAQDQRQIETNAAFCRQISGVERPR